MNDQTNQPVKLKMPVLADAMLGGRFVPATLSMSAAKAFLVVIGSLLLAASAQFKIPLYPVPVTGQTLVVLLIGMTYGARLGGVTVAAYLFQGAVGLPVFAGGAFGIATLFGVTGGYLFGFLAAAVAMGKLAERGMGRTVTSTVIAMLIGNLVIYLMGATWLGSFIGFEKAVAVGVVPFLYGDVAKLIVAAGLMPVAWRLVKSAQD
ncbi:MAG: biotin transporter BioY [Candidatus Puniceispirillum sp.]